LHNFLLWVFQIPLSRRMMGLKPKNFGMFTFKVRAANYFIIQKRSCYLTVDLATSSSQNKALR
jgi:hypothetical protein